MDCAFYDGRHIYGKISPYVVHTRPYVLREQYIEKYYSIEIHQGFKITTSPQKIKYFYNYNLFWKNVCVFILEIN